MDCGVGAKIKELVEDLAREHQQELADAGTLVDLKELTSEIGGGWHAVTQRSCGSACLRFA